MGSFFVIFNIDKTNVICYHTNMGNKYYNLLNELGYKNKSNNLVGKLADCYELINNYKELNAEQLINGARLIMRDKKVHNYRHVAIRFLETAIEKGSEEAKFLLAQIYFNGRGNRNPEENAKAAKLYKELSDSGNLMAKRIYADMIYFSYIEEVEREVIGYGRVDEKELLRLFEVYESNVVPQKMELTVREICEITHQRKSEIYKDIRIGRLNAYKKGNKYFVLQEDVERYLEKIKLQQKIIFIIILFLILLSLVFFTFLLH